MFKSFNARFGMPALLGGIFLFSMLSSATNQVKFDTSFVGTWEGTLTAGGAKLRIVLHLVKNDSGTWTATLDSPDQGARGIQASSASINGDSVIILVASIGGSLEGRLSTDKSAIVGAWKQSGGIFPLTLSRTTKVVEINRPQEPKPPFPYRSEEVVYNNTAEGVRLAGTLTLPDSGTRFPAVIMITGSGPQNRDEEILGHKPFLVIADYLTRRGIAVLRVDDRGVGGSSGGSQMNSTTADYATDVEAGITYLKGRPEIEPNEIGLIGHSEGGIIAPMVAAQSSDVAFIVMLAGTGYSLDKIIVDQSKLLNKAAGIPEEQIEKNTKLLRDEINIVESNKDSAAIADKLRRYLSSTYSDWGGEPGKSGMDSSKLIEGQIKSLDSPWFRFALTYDPRSALEKVKCPVLAMGGTLDLQVPAEENLKAIEQALKRGGNKDYTIKLMPGLNHLFQHAKSGSVLEYSQIEETFSPEALKLIGDWILEKAGTR